MGVKVKQCRPTLLVSEPGPRSSLALILGKPQNTDMNKTFTLPSNVLLASLMGKRELANNKSVTSFTKN